MASNRKDINDTRCKTCGLIQPCPCDAEKCIHDVDKREVEVEQPIIILNKRRQSKKRRHSYPEPGEMRKYASIWSGTPYMRVTSICVQNIEYMSTKQDRKVIIIFF